MRFTLFIFTLCCLCTQCSKQDKAEEQTNDSEKNHPEAPEGMVYVPGGTYLRGNETDPGNGYSKEEGPIHEVSITAFFMDEHEVTNAQFKAFVEDTGYVTFAEKGPSPSDFPNAPVAALAAGANVFSAPKEEIDPRKQSAWQWWKFLKGATWKSPEGPGSDIAGRMDHPVVCVNYDDAAAYAKWAKKRLPTEAEWERASRGGKKQLMYEWGNKVTLEGAWQTNAFQGIFPHDNTAKDGFKSTAPVKSYKPNGYGIYDLSGNVWEICSDYFRPDYYSWFKMNIHPDPKGPSKPITDHEFQQWLRTGICQDAPAQTPSLIHMRVSRGGSFLCHESYCLRFRPSARHYHEPITPANHTGFRCVQDIPTK